jgi:hypothetical protein
VAVGLLAELLGAGLQLAALFAWHSITASVLQERTGWPTYSTWLPDSMRLDGVDGSRLSCIGRRPAEGPTVLRDGVFRPLRAGELAVTGDWLVSWLLWVAGARGPRRWR